MRIAGRQDERSVPPPPGQEVPLDIVGPLVGMDQAGLGRLRHQVDEVRPGLLGENSAELLGGDVALADQDLAQARAPGLLRRQGVAQLGRRDQPLAAQELADRLQHLRRLLGQNVLVHLGHDGPPALILPDHSGLGLPNR